MKWFNIGAIAKEIKKIRWPSREDLTDSSVRVIIIILFFALFFVLCEFIVSLLLKAIGVIG